MIYTPIAQAAIPGIWAGLWRLLEPAAAHDTTETKDSLYAALSEGRMAAWLVSGEASGLIVTRIDEDDGVKTARIHYAAGTARLSHMKQILRDFEEGSRQAGCERIRCAGRKGWARVTGYDVLSDNNGKLELVKVLHG